MTIEIVDFPINSMVMFHRFLLTFTRPGKVEPDGETKPSSLGPNSLGQFSRDSTAPSTNKSQRSSPFSYQLYIVEKIAIVKWSLPQINSQKLVKANPYC